MKHFFFLLKRMLVLLFWGSAVTMNAQTEEWRQYLELLSEEEDYERMDWEAYEELLADCAENPININTASREELENFPFLSAKQVEDILAYIHRYGQMRSLGELAMIRSIGWCQRQLLGYFVYVGEVEKASFPTLGNIVKYGKHEVAADVKIPFYERKGDKEGYLGYPYKHWFRYQFRRGEFVKAGFLGSQDAGEPFFGGKNTCGYDFYSFYLQICKWGRIRNLTIGRYRLREGMGLVLNNDFSLGKMSALSNLTSMGTTIRVHSSRSAANYLQGAAATFQLLKGLHFTAFVSSRKIDATVKGDSISTIVTTGLHRTEKEIEKQKVASAFLMGSNLNYRLGGFSFGTTAIWYSYSLPLHPNKSLLYKRFAPEGKDFWNASLDYGFLSHRFSFHGETATGDCGTFATVNAASYLFSEHFTLSGLYRFYPYRYYALYGNSFSAGSETQDESGMFLGLEWKPSSHWQVEIYGDLAYFAWPKYHTTGSTYSRNCSLSILYRPSDFMSFGLRGQYKQKQSNIFRIKSYFTVSHQKWACKTQVDMSALTNSIGYMVSENLSFHYRWLRLTNFWAYFHTQDYDSRVYGYEPSMLYSMGFGNFFGHGFRGVLLVKADWGKFLTGECKWAVTHYFDRSAISSGMQEIASPTQTDLEVLLKLKF